MTFLNKLGWDAAGSGSQVLDNGSTANISVTPMASGQQISGNIVNLDGSSAYFNTTQNGDGSFYTSSFYFDSNGKFIGSAGTGFDGQNVTSTGYFTNGDNYSCNIPNNSDKYSKEMFGPGAFDYAKKQGWCEGQIDPRTKTAADAAKAALPPRHDPLIFDLNGDGLSTIGISSTNPILFDHNADGIKTGTGWVKPDDAFLVLDKNGNGTIDTGRELFGDATLKSNGQLASNGFDALADLDSIANGGNGDGIINASDTQYAGLRLWRDLNQDGISQTGELFSLASQNIIGINVASNAHSQILPNGNQLADTGSFIKADGTQGEVGAVTGNLGDINLASDTFHRSFTTPLDTSSVATLPDMQGSGVVRDLREAATQSATLQNALTQYAATTTATGQLAQIDQLLDAWADTGELAESLDDRAEQTRTVIRAEGSTYQQTYRVRYNQLGNITRTYKDNLITGEGGFIEARPRDVDNTALTDSYRAQVTAWTQKLHIIETFNGSYRLLPIISDFKASFTRVCQPLPSALKYANTSASKRMAVYTLGEAALGRPGLRLVSISDASSAPIKPANTSDAGLKCFKSAKVNSRTSPDVLVKGLWVFIARYLSLVSTTQTNHSNAASNLHKTKHMQALVQITNRHQALLGVSIATIDSNASACPIKIHHTCKRQLTFSQVFSRFGWVKVDNHGNYCIHNNYWCQIGKLKQATLKLLAANDSD